METRKKCLGRLEHHRDFNPEEEQIFIDLYKGLDIYIEPLSDRIPVTREEYYKKIIQKFDKISEERSELVRTLRDRVTKFENDQMMIKFCKQYGELFNDNEFNVSESSIDDYKDSDSDADNNNKKNDDERKMMADGNKKRIKEGGIKAKDDGDDNIKDKDGSEAKDDGYEVKDDVNNENDFENLSGHDTEDEVSMDIDIPNEEMKQKEADKEKVSDKNRNESKKEKQYEADKVEKVQEIQEEHNRLTQNQFWDKEYDLADKQYEELEVQAIKDIKKKQKNQEKVNCRHDTLSFSLSLSPTENEPKSKNKEERFEKEENVEKRAKKPSWFLVSPYLNKKTSIKGKTTCDEVTMTEYLFSMEGEELDFVFETKDGAATIRDYMQTLAPQLKVESNVIDSFSLILNHEQKMNSNGNTIKYFSTQR
nr:peptidase C48, SUMO/sentrin/Ubl1 [Tanacetum cinerariifolium]